MSTQKKPDLSDPKLRAKLAQGMGHNYYGEPAWPNDLLYIFPVVIMGSFACIVALAVLDPAMIRQSFCYSFGNFARVVLISCIPNSPLTTQ